MRIAKRGEIFHLAEVLQFSFDYTIAHGAAPIQRDIDNFLQLASGSTSRKLRSMLRQGYIEFVPKPRGSLGVVLTEKGLEHVKGDAKEFDSYAEIKKGES